MTKLNKKSRAADESVASAIVVNGPSERVTRSIAHMRSARATGKDTNPAPSPNKRRREATAQPPNKRPRRKGPTTSGSEEDSDLDPAALAAINGFKGSKALRTRASHIEVCLPSSKDMADRSAFRLDSQTKPLPPAGPPTLEHEDVGREKGPRLEPEPKQEEEHNQEQEQEQEEAQEHVQEQEERRLQQELELEWEAHRETEMARNKKSDQASQPTSGHGQAVANTAGPAQAVTTPGDLQLLNPRPHPPQELQDAYANFEDQETQGVQVSSNASTTSSRPKQTINGLQAPLVKRNVRRLPSRPWIDPDDDGWGYPDEAPRRRKKTPIAPVPRRPPPPAKVPAPQSRLKPRPQAPQARHSPNLERQRPMPPSSSPFRTPSPAADDVVEVDEDGQVLTDNRPSVAVSSMANQAAVQVSSGAVVSMHQIMGRLGWTGRKTHWSKHLAPDRADCDPHGTTRLGQSLFTYLFQLNAALAKIPKAPHFEEQVDYMETNFKDLKDRMSQVRKLLVKIREERLAPVGESDRRANGDLDQRRAMVHDILHYIMPMLVHILWTAFSLGGIEYDDNRVHLSEEGTFTKTPLACLNKVSDWITRLMETLDVELRIRPFDNDPQKHQGREEFRLALENWMIELGVAQDQMDELLTAEERMLQARQKDLRVQEARMRKEEEADAEFARNWSAMADSTHRIAQLKNPLAERFERRWRASQTPTASLSSRQTSVAERRIPYWPQHPATPSQLDYTLFDLADRQWLLGELQNPKGIYRRHDGRPCDNELEYFANTLEIPLEEVKREIERLRGGCRVVAREKGGPLPPWAR